MSHTGSAAYLKKKKNADSDSVSRTGAWDFVSNKFHSDADADAAGRQTMLRSKALTTLNYLSNHQEFNIIN